MDSPSGEPATVVALPPSLPPPAAPRTTSSATLGDRWLLALWLAMGLAMARALLQALVDATAGEERGIQLLEHVVEHFVEATGRTWWIVPPLAILPRGARFVPGLLRTLLVAGASAAVLAGWPDGELRYTPGIDSMRGYQGWAAIAVLALALGFLDRYSLAPHRALYRLAPTTRIVATSAVLVLGGGALAAVVALLDARRRTLELEAIVVDLLDELPGARLEPGLAGGTPSVGSLLALRSKQVEGGNQPSLLLPVGAAATFELAPLPPLATLRFGVGVDCATIIERDPPPQQLRFTVAVDGVEVHVTTLRPQERNEDRSWFDGAVDLGAQAGRPVAVTFALEGEGLRLGDVRAGIGRPRVVARQWRPRAASGPERMNVVLVAVDSLRADRLGCYGCDAPTSPAIDQLAREGVVYERARAPATWAWPAIATLLTGLHPPQHGVDDIDRCFLSDSLTTLPEHLAAQGCTTLGATANPLITRTKNFQQGFEDWRDLQLEPAERLADQFAEWSARYREWQFFALLHLHDPHRPFNPPPAVGERFVPVKDVAAMRTAVNELRRVRAEQKDPARAPPPVAAEEDVAPRLSEASWRGLYDAEVRAVDDQVARIVTLLRKLGLLDRTVIVVAGTHGESLAMGTPPPAGSSLAPEMRSVPLVIRDPRRAPQRVAELVDLAALAPTLAQLAGVPPPSPATEAVLPPWGPGAPRFAYFHTARGLLPGRTDLVELLGIESADERLVMTGAGEVIEYVDERGDRPEATRRAALLERLKQWRTLLEHDAVARPFERPDFATRQALERLEESEPGIR